MSKWVLKAVVQKVLSLVPIYSHRLNFLFQKYVTKGVDLNDDYFKIKSRHLGENYNFLKNNHTNKPVHVLDIGTGWYPIVPLGYWLAGMEYVITYDVARLTDDEKVRITAKRLLENESYLLKAYNLQFTDERKVQLRKILKDNEPNILNSLGIQYIIGNLVGHDLIPKKESLTAISSNNTLEHVDDEQIVPLFQYLQLCLQKGGVMSHFIDLTDHYAHMDNSISVYHFLKFSSDHWKLIDNSIQPMNRWRWPQYIDLHSNTGFEIIDTDIWPFEIQDIERQHINETFTDNYSKEDIAICHGYIVSRKRNDNEQIAVL